MVHLCHHPQRAVLIFWVLSWSFSSGQEIRVISDKVRADDDAANIENDWKFAAMVLDRICLITFSLFTIIATIVVLAAAPHVIVKWKSRNSLCASFAKSSLQVLNTCQCKIISSVSQRNIKTDLLKQLNITFLNEKVRNRVSVLYCLLQKENYMMSDFYCPWICTIWISYCRELPT